MEYLKVDHKFGQICVNDQDVDCMTYGHMIKVKKAAKKVLMGFATDAKLIAKRMNLQPMMRHKTD